MDPYLIAVNAGIAIGSLLMLIAPFSENFRGAASWLRSGMFIAGVIGLLRAGVGIYVESLYSIDAVSARSSPFESIRLHLSGVLIGIFLTLFLSSEFRQRGMRFTGPKR